MDMMNGARVGMMEGSRSVCESTSGKATRSVESMSRMCVEREKRGEWCKAECVRGDTAISEKFTTQNIIMARIDFLSERRRKIHM